MRIMTIILFTAVCLAPVRAQNSVWIKVEKGEAMLLRSDAPQWEPLGVRTEVPLRSFLLTKPGAVVRLYRATESFEVPENSYLFADDLLPRNRSEIVGALTRIEAEQLPALPQGTDTTGGGPVVGLTYGAKAGGKDPGEIPYRTERWNAVSFLLRSGRNDAAVVALKRMMTKYPSLYLEPMMVERLFALYETLDLNGFLFDESTRLLALFRTGEFNGQLQQWNTKARQKVTDGN